MALLTAPFPNPDNTSLAKLVLEGLAQMKQELNAQTQISQDEQNNFLAQSKQASLNMLGIANAQATVRDQNRQQSQDQFNNYLGLQKLALDRTSVNADAAYKQAHANYLMNQMNQQPIPDDVPQNLTQPTAAADAGRAGAIHDMAGDVVNQAASSANLLMNPAIGMSAAVPNGMLTTATNNAPSQPTLMQQPPAFNAPTINPRTTEGGVPVNLPMPEGSAPQNTNPMLGAPGAGPAATPTPAPSGYRNPDGSVNIAKAPYGQQELIAPNLKAARIQLGSQDAVQLYKRVTKKQPNGQLGTAYVEDGPPRILQPQLAPGATTGRPIDFATIPTGSMAWVAGNEFVMRQQVGDNYQIQSFKGTQPVIQNGHQARGPDGAPLFGGYAIDGAPKKIVKSITPGEKETATPIFNAKNEYIGDEFVAGDGKVHVHYRAASELGSNGLKQLKPTEIGQLYKMESETGGLGNDPESIAAKVDAFNRANGLKGDKKKTADSMTPDDWHAATVALQAGNDKLRTTIDALQKAGRVIPERFQKYLPQRQQVTPPQQQPVRPPLAAAANPVAPPSTASKVDSLLNSLVPSS